MQSLQDFGFKPLHAKRVQKWRVARRAGEGEPPAAAPHESVTPAQRPSSAEAIQLADGSNLRVGVLIGRGGSATVHKARWIEHGRERHVAVKRLVTGASERELAKFQKELQLITLAAKRCENVCRVHGAFQHEGEMVLVMKEYVEDLTSLLSREGPLPVARALRYAEQICRGICSLHEERITIFDLKPANILLDETDQIAISDFGISKLQGTLTNTVTTSTAAEQSGVGAVGGTPQFQAPEQYDPEAYGRPTTPADMWAFGCVLLSLLTGANPWPELSGTQIMVAILNKKRSPELPRHVPTEVAEIMRKCLMHNPKARPSAAQVLAMLSSASAVVAMAQASNPAAANDPNRPTTRTKCTEEMEAWAYADSIIQSSWAKRDQYEFDRLVQVEEIDNPRLKAKFDAYKATLPGDSQGDQLVFHGCSSEALHSIVEFGFDRSYWKSAAGDWQRFGPAFYYALNSSKSHEYPLQEMQALLPNGTYTKSMLLCKIAKGRCLQTSKNMPHLSGCPPTGYDSIHGRSTPGGPLNFDELVVFNEAAILPYAIATYTFKKLSLDQSTSVVPTTLRENSFAAAEGQQQEVAGAAGPTSATSELESPSAATESPFAFLATVGGAEMVVGGFGQPAVEPHTPSPATTISTVDSLHSFHADLAALGSASSSPFGVPPVASSSFSTVDLLSSAVLSQTRGHGIGLPLHMECSHPRPSEGSVAGDLMDIFTPRRDNQDVTREFRALSPAPEPAAVPEQPGAHIDTVATYLSSLGLGAHADRMIADGFTDVGELRGLSREELESLCNPFLKRALAMADADGTADGHNSGTQWLSGGSGTFADASVAPMSTSGRGSRLLYDPAQRQSSGGSGSTLGGGTPKQYVVAPDNAYMRNVADRTQLIPGTVYMSARNLSFRSDLVNSVREVNAKCPLAQVVQVAEPVACKIPVDAPLQAEVVDYREMSLLEVTFIHSESIMKKAVLMKKTEDRVVVVHFIVATQTASRIYEALMKSGGKHQGGGSQRGRSKPSSKAVEVVDGVAWAAPSRLSSNSR